MFHAGCDAVRRTTRDVLADAQATTRAKSKRRCVIRSTAEIRINAYSRRANSIDVTRRYGFDTPEMHSRNTRETLADCASDVKTAQLAGERRDKRRAGGARRYTGNELIASHWSVAVTRSAAPASRRSNSRREMCAKSVTDGVRKECDLRTR